MGFSLPIAIFPPRGCILRLLKLGTVSLSTTCIIDLPFVKTPTFIDCPDVFSIENCVLLREVVITSVYVVPVKTKECEAEAGSLIFVSGRRDVDPLTTRSFVIILFLTFRIPVISTS